MDRDYKKDTKEGKQLAIKVVPKISEQDFEEERITHIIYWKLCALLDDLGFERHCMHPLDNENKCFEFSGFIPGDKITDDVVSAIKQLVPSEVIVGKVAPVGKIMNGELAGTPLWGNVYD